MAVKRKKSVDAATLESRRAKDRERKRRHRANLSEEQLQHKRQKDMERYNRLKQENKIKTVKDRTPREVRKLRKYWRDSSKKYRAKKKAALNSLNNTPPPSPVSNLEENCESVQKVRGRKKVRKDKAKVYRTVNKQKKYILELERKLEKYKKRLEREKKKHENQGSPSPRKKVQKLIGREKVSPDIKKELFAGYALKKQLESKAKEAGNKTKQQQIFCKNIGSNILKKYRVQQHFKKVIPYKMNKALSCTDKTNYTRQKRQCVTQKNKKALVSFFEDDSTSKMCPGKRDFVRKGKLKKQRRILLDSLQNLHRRFTQETSIKMSFATFARSRPFWVTPPKKSDRETCACVRHCNMEHMVFALKSNKVITENNVDKVVSAVVCSMKNEDCMLGRCSVCANKQLNYSYDSNFKIKFWKWKKVKEERLINKKKKIIKKTVKVKETMTVKKIIYIFNEELKNFKKHVFYHYHQAKQLNNKKKKLKENELLVRVDFSENYVCKYYEEIQSVHFGASKRQICLNTGIWYAVVSHSFATVSNNLDHQAHAIWAHMRPILERTARLYPNTDTIHFFSDSPSSQYRNRINMYLMKLLVPKIMEQIKCITWNFTEAGHGKGPMDGVGGALKRMADQHVSHGTDITSAADFITALQSTRIMMTEVKSEDVQKLKSEVETMNIPQIKGIMSVHQVTYKEYMSSVDMYVNSLSCFACDPSQTCCKHYLIKPIFQDESQLGQPIQKSPLDLLAHDLTSDFESDGEEVILRPKRSTASAKSYAEKVFSSSEDEGLPLTCDKTTDEPSTAGQASRTKDVYAPVDNIKLGSFLLVRFNAKTNKKNKNNHRQFVGVSQSDIEDGEIDVMFLKQLTGDNTCFCINEKDMSTIDTKQIVAVLPNPNLMMKGDRVFYKFPYPINVF